MPLLRLLSAPKSASLARKVRRARKERKKRSAKRIRSTRRRNVIPALVPAPLPALAPVPLPALPVLVPVSRAALPSASPNTTTR